MLYLRFWDPHLPKTSTTIHIQCWLMPLHAWCSGLKLNMKNSAATLFLALRYKKQKQNKKQKNFVRFLVIICWKICCCSVFQMHKNWILLSCFELTAEILAADISKPWQIKLKLSWLNTTRKNMFNLSVNEVNWPFKATQKPFYFCFVVKKAALFSWQKARQL